MHHARRIIATQRCIEGTPTGGGAISRCVRLHAHIGVGVPSLSPWTASLYRAPRHFVVFYGSGGQEAPVNSLSQHETPFFSKKPFVARHDTAIAAGVLCARCGKSSPSFSPNQNA